ncbi:MAG: S24 family peptidase [Bacillota bacterium]|nr:S24 family peptidase [Bacillota bacterium]
MWIFRAMDIDGSATLKRFRPMGSSILLIAENKNYEPIILDGGDVNIIGVAVGRIK